MMRNNLNSLIRSSLNVHKLYSNLNITRRASDQCKKQVVFSGIQPTGVPHLGNYFGAIELWKDLQDDQTKNCIFSLVNLHSLTAQPISSDYIRNHTYIMLACFLGCGLDPDKSILFRQSDVLEHAQLCWILSCHFTMSALNRLPAFREKSLKLQDIGVPVGLFLYPSLQAADILIYKTNLVPIGKDNLANLHLAQDIIDKLNLIYKSNFPKPDVLINEQVACIKSLREPEKKMSKSDTDKMSKIMILDEPDDIIKKIKKAKTDFTSTVYYDPENRPGVSNLILLQSLITGKPIDQLVNEASHLDTGKYKMVLGEQLVEFLKPIKLKTNEAIKDKQYLDSILEKGSDKARAIASNTLDEISKLLGLK